MTAALFLALFAVYLVTCCPSVSVDDSGEFCIAALELGVPHPPGYPLYTLLLALWRWIPAGSVALRLNLLSAVLVACAGCLMFHLLKRAMAPLDRRSLTKWIGWVGAFLSALSLGLWSQAGTVKGGVYGLNLCLILVVVLSFMSIGGRGHLLLSGALGAGLGLANHWMSAIGLLPGLAWVLAGSATRHWRGATHSSCGGHPAANDAWRRTALVGGFLVLGVSLYLCLPLHAIRKPFLNWGIPDRLSQLSFVVVRQQYLGSTPEEREPLAGRLKQVGQALDGAAPWWLLCAGGAAGFAWLLRSAPGGAIATLIFLLVFYGSLLWYGPLRPGAPWYMEIFSIPGTTLLFWSATVGVSALALRSSRRLGPWVMFGLAGWLALTAIPERWKKCDRSREYLTNDLALNVGAHTLPRNLFFAQSDAVVFGGWYLWLTGMRLDGAIVVPSPLLPMPWIAEGFARRVPGLRVPYPALRVGAESVPTLIRAWVEANSPKFTAYTFMTDAARQAFGRDSMIEHGLVYRVEMRERGGRGGGSPPRLQRLRFRGLFGEELHRLPRKQASIQPIYFTGLLAQGSGAARPGALRAGVDLAQARRALTMAGWLAASVEDQAAVALAQGNFAVSEGRNDEAVDLYQEAYAKDPSLTIALRNLAMLYLSQRRNSQALEIMKRLQEQAPDSEEARELAPIALQLERARQHRR